jgi:hypothetical protein
MESGRNWESMPNQSSDPDLSYLDRQSTPNVQQPPSGMSGTTEQAYQQSLPGAEGIQQKYAAQNAMAEGELDPSELQMRGMSPDTQLPSPELYDVQKPKPTVGRFDTDVMGMKAKNAAIGAAGHLGKATKGVLGFGGSMLNSFLYGGGSKKNLSQNLNKTLYGGKGTLGENVFGPRPKGRGAEGIGAEGGSDVAEGALGGGWGDQTSEGKSKPSAGGFKGAFAAARKAGDKEFIYKGKKYNTLRKDKKKLKKPNGQMSYRNQIKRQSKGNYKNSADSILSGGRR